MVRWPRKKADCSRCALLLISTAILATSCGGAGSERLGVDVSFESGLPRSLRDSATRVEVYVVDSCVSVSTGEEPGEAIASTFTLRDGRSGPFLGVLDPGQYGIYVLARDAMCTVVAAGCTAATIDAAAQGPLSVTLAAFSGAGCSGDEQCVVDTSECVPLPVDCVDRPDETSCASGNSAGRCRMGECCTGCWDGSQCLSGDSRKDCGAGGQLCEDCGVPGGVCAAGECI